MKKLLLTLAVGLSMLSLPVIAGAAQQQFIDYSGFTGHVVVRGMYEYTNLGGTKVLRPFFPVRAFGASSKVNNTNIRAYAVPGDQTFDLTAMLNSATVLAVSADNNNYNNGTLTSFIAPGSGKYVMGNGSFILYYNPKGATTQAIYNSYNYSVGTHPYKAGLTASLDILDGNCLLVGSNNPNTNTSVMTMVNPAVSNGISEVMFAGYSTAGGQAWRNYSSAYLPYAVTNVNISPIKFHKVPVLKGYTSVAGSWFN